MTDDGSEEDRMIETLQEDIEDLKHCLDDTRDRLVYANSEKRCLTQRVEALQKRIDDLVSEKDRLHHVIEEISVRMLDEAKARDEEDATFFELLGAAHSVHRVLIGMLLKKYCNGYVASLPACDQGYDKGVSRGSGYWFFPDYASAAEAVMIVAMQRIDEEESVERN